MLVDVEPRPELPMAPEPPPPLDEMLEPLLPDELPPTRLVEAFMAEEPLRGAPLKPPPPVLPVLATVPVALSDEEIELREIEDVEPTVMVDFVWIRFPPDRVRPRPLRLPRSRGAIRLANLSACVVPVSRMVCCNPLVSTLAVGSCATAVPAASGSAPVGRSCQYRPPAISRISVAASHGQRLRFGFSGGGTISGTGPAEPEATSGAEASLLWSCIATTLASRPGGDTGASQSLV
jgi:hypothetical protein